MGERRTLCLHCGTVLPHGPDERFCTNCGARLPQPPVTAPVLRLPVRSAGRAAPGGARDAWPAPAAGGTDHDSVPATTTAPRSGDAIALSYRMARAAAAGRALCRRCGTPLRPHTRFCVTCGQPLPALTAAPARGA